jgi:hypothetical protein
VVLGCRRVSRTSGSGPSFSGGRYIGSRGPSLFWIIPFVEGVSAWIDQRTIDVV